MSKEHIKPSHYNDFDITTFDVVEDWRLGFYLGNVVKYIQRVDIKDDPHSNLEKAICYLIQEYKYRGGDLDVIREKIIND